PPIRGLALVVPIHRQHRGGLGRIDFFYFCQENMIAIGENVFQGRESFDESARNGRQAEPRKAQAQGPYPSGRSFHVASLVACPCCICNVSSSYLNVRRVATENSGEESARRFGHF